jgi:hypothetical protein
MPLPPGSFRMAFSENRLPSSEIMRFCMRLSLSENRVPSPIKPGTDFFGAMR